MAGEDRGPAGEGDDQRQAADYPVVAAERRKKATPRAGSRVLDAARAATKIATRPPTQIAEAIALTTISGADAAAGGHG